MASMDLTPGAASIFDAVKSRYDLDDSEAEKLSNLLMSEVGRRLHAGETLAFVKANADGQGEITILGLTVRAKSK